MNRFCFLLILVLTGNLFAQPRFTPITWGPPRTISEGLPDLNNYPWQIVAKGDTLVELKTYLNVWGGVNTVVRVSSDNGFTWCSWHSLNDTVTTRIQEEGSAAITSQGILVANPINTYPTTYGIFRSTNLGQTWITPTVSYSFLPTIMQAIGDTLILVHGYQSSWTANAGTTIPPLVDFFSGLPNLIATRSFSGNHRWIFGLNGYNNTFPSGANRVAFQRRLYNGVVTDSTQIFYPNTVFSIDWRCEFDDEGNGALVIETDTTAPMPDYTAIHRFISHDSGRTWSQPFDLTPVQTVASAGGGNLHSTFFINHSGHRWMVAWMDTTCDSTINRQQYSAVEKLSFSPNRGYYWYPSTQTPIIDNSFFVSATIACDFGPTYVRIFGFYETYRDTAWRYYFYEKEGTITPDITPPTMSNATSFPVSVRGDTILPIHTTSSDNDSVWNVILVVKRIGALDSLLDTLRYDSLNLYTGSYTTPRDSGEYVYYYVSQDLWENRAYYPDSTVANLPNFWVGPATAVKEQSNLPQEPIIRAFPNPVNGMITFSGRITATHNPIKLHIYNLTGALVATVDIHPTVSGNYRTVWDCRNSNGNPVASGVYFAQINVQAKNKLVRFSIVH